MSRLRLSPLLVLAVFAAQACDPFTIDNRDPTPVIEESTAKAEPQAPGAPESDFGFRFERGACFSDVLDTFEGTFTKDLVPDPPVTIPLRMSSEQMQAVYAKMVEMDFFGYPAVFAIATPTSGLMTIQTPAERYRIVVTSGGASKTLEWVDEIVDPTSREADDLRALFDMIEGMITASPQYQQLPERSGGCA